MACRFCARPARPAAKGQGIAAIALAAGLAAFMEMPSGGEVTLGMLAVVSGLRWHGAIFEFRERGLPAALLASSDPAALCRLGGEVLDANEAMLGSDRLPTEGIAALLGKLVECDAALIYRLSRNARELGFAFEQVPERLNKHSRQLVVTSTGGERMLWRILPAERLAGAVPSAFLDEYEAASFAYLRLQPDGTVRTNIRFREVFGADPAGVLAQLVDEEGNFRTGRRMIAGSDGISRAVRVWAKPAVGPEAGVREVLIFDGAQNDAPSIQTEDALAQLPVALVQVSAAGRILWLNAAAERMLGDRAAPGRLLGDILDTRSRPLMSLIDEALATHRQAAPETVHLAGDRGERFLQITFTRARGGETLLAVLSDASELRQLEDKFAQSQKMEAVGKLAGGVAHDFNNLLTAINGHCDLLLVSKDAKQPEYSDLMQIRQNANRAAALVRQLLAFSRKQTLNPEFLSINDVISDTLYLLDRLIGDRVTLVLDAAPQRQMGLVRVDQRQLEQAIINLVVNARDAMPDGGKVTISTRRRIIQVDEQRQGALLPAGDYAELAVADQGRGIDGQVIDKVFDPFFTTKPQGEGTGLGLSTVYGIVKQSGGFVFAENRPEGGACFRMLLPHAAPASAAASAEPEAETPALAPDLTGQGSVLLVEDEAAVRSFAARALRLRGYDVVTADSAAEALDLLSDPACQLDLIVSDVMMPGMDGPAFVAKARELRPGLRVLFVSGYAEETLRKHMVNPDYAFLPKPFSLSDLTAKVKEVLGRA